LKIATYIVSFLDNFPEIKQLVKKLYYLPGSFISLFKQPYQTVASEIKLFSQNGEDCFFGYYDQSPQSPESQKVTYHRVVKNSEIEIIWQDGERREIVSRNQAWNLQQGSRLSWVAGCKDTLVFNSLKDDQLVATMIDENGEQKFLNSPMAAISEDGTMIASCDFKVISELNPEYGYGTGQNNSFGFNQVTHGTIWIENIENNSISASISLDQILDCKPRDSFHSANHEINHLSFSPSGEKLAFMHRWYLPSGRRESRLLSVSLKSKALEVLMDDGMVSHYCWVSETNIFVYGTSASHGTHFYTLSFERDDPSVEIHEALKQYGDGHPSFNKSTGLIVFDSYPDWKRYQHLFVYSIKDQKVAEVGKFRSPLKYFGPARCDLHPRWDSKGEQIAIDVCYAGHRDLMTIDLKEWMENW